MCSRTRRGFSRRVERHRGKIEAGTGSNERWGDDPVRPERAIHRSVEVELIEIDRVETESRY